MEEGQTMATHLYRLGGWAFRRRKTVLALWAVVLAGVIAIEGEQLVKRLKEHPLRPDHQPTTRTGKARSGGPFPRKGV
jgi:hypothetical protein